MCREKVCGLIFCTFDTGSPLRVQGKDLCDLTLNCGCRITPACAGKRNIRILRAKHTQDHPCVCREKSPIDYGVSRYIGSPLRVQGKDNYLHQIHETTRITPACAGKRTVFKIRPVAAEDHPCVCREKRRA